MGYSETFIVVADDCPVTSSVVPAPRGGKKTVAVHHYELLAGSPYTLTQEDVLFETWLRQNDLAEGLDDAQRAKLWDEFFSTAKACLRASPLPKKCGFGLHYDVDGRIALFPVESATYARLAGEAGDGHPAILKAFRSKRA